MMVKPIPFEPLRAASFRRQPVPRYAGRCLQHDDGIVHANPTARVSPISDKLSAYSAHGDINAAVATGCLGLTAGDDVAVGGYTLDNWSLMGLTIAVGSSWTMPSSCWRHLPAYRGRAVAERSRPQGLEGNRLHHHVHQLVTGGGFIPLLLMGGIIGRLFREFAITVTMTIIVSAFVALTLSPMMCSLFLRDERKQSTAARISS